MNLNIKYQLFESPFPHIIYENFLSEVEQKEILNEILEVDNKSKVNKVMGGRYQYPVDQFNDKCITKKLFDFFNSKKTFETLRKGLLPDVETSEFYLKSNKFNKFLNKKNFYHKFLKKIFPFIFKKSFFLHMDFSVAKNNYFREPHHDKENRIISLLLYINTTADKHEGALEIFQFRDKERYERFPKQDKIFVEKKVEPKSGRLVAFLSCPNSIHGVQKFEPKNNEKRVFAYGSYTSFFNVEWLRKVIK